MGMKTTWLVTHKADDQILTNEFFDYKTALHFYVKEINCAREDCQLIMWTRYDHE